ncbi:MAG TPA: FHA domain-containing protein [Vicinamibacterales bacterium]|nr:FHA domain-containing protein [Vicinamibacterales bacterium]
MALFGRKSLRQFACNDALWATFERMAGDQEKNVDELLNDALESYAQLAGYQTGIDAEAEAERDARDELDGPSTPPPGTHHGRPTNRVAPVGHAPPPPPPLPAATRFGRPIPAPKSALGGMFQAGATTPPPPSPSYASFSDGAPGVPAPPLYLVFDNQKYRIDKDQFIIGRGAKSSDLPIKDGNISRKHAAVIRRNGTYFIKDLGSTNGIDYKDMRIDNKRIDEGDVFHLCDYELRFTYKR